MCVEPLSRRLSEIGTFCRLLKVTNIRVGDQWSRTSLTRWQFCAVVNNDRAVLFSGNPHQVAPIVILVKRLGAGQ